RHERGQAARIEIVGTDVAIGHRSGRAVLGGIEHADAKTQALRRHAEHAPELATPQQAEPGAGRQGIMRVLHATSPGWTGGAAGRRPDEALRQLGGTTIERADSVCRARKPSRRSASAGSVVASVATTCSAALAAPASPIAKVATGMPRGICTIESRESSPRRYFDGTGTPSTGTVVFDAIMPGRCAAPPAPAMIARKPRSRACSA